MKLIPISLIVFCLFVIIFPEIIAFLVGGLLIFLWVNGLIIGKIFKKSKNASWKYEEPVVQFGNYKIFR